MKPYNLECSSGKMRELLLLDEDEEMSIVFKNKDKEYIKIIKCIANKKIKGRLKEKEQIMHILELFNKLKINLNTQNNFIYHQTIKKILESLI